MVRALLAWHDENAKHSPLKTLHGLIWEQGFADGELVGQVYPDVPPALAGWRQRGIGCWIYSSGSVLAQRLWFSHNDQGDLTGLLAGHFDTTNAGPKQEPLSYRRIAASIGSEPGDILFLTDSRAELDAAGHGRLAGGRGAPARLRDRLRPAPGGRRPQQAGGRPPRSGRSVAMTASTPVGVIGGSGLYSLLTDAEQVSVETPYGPPSGELVRGEVGGREVVFLPRHGRDHRHPAHVINYRANLWALRSLGVRQVLGAVRGRFAAARHSGRARSCCPTSSSTAPPAGPGRSSTPARCTWPSPTRTARTAGPRCSRPPPGSTSRSMDGATMVVIDGPRFATRAESRHYAGQGWDLINMTGMPEAVLARELAMCYTSLALVTDLDAGVDEGSAVAQDEVFRVFAANIERLRELVLATVAELGEQGDCRCAHAHDGLDHPVRAARSG